MTVRMRVFRTRHPIGPGWLWACSDTTPHGSRNGDDWPSWLPPFRDGRRGGGCRPKPLVELARAAMRILRRAHRRTPRRVHLRLPLRANHRGGSAVTRRRKRVAGHALIRAGSPVLDIPGDGHTGSALCACGDRSPVLPSNRMRRQWYRGHLRSEVEKAGGRS